MYACYVEVVFHFVAKAILFLCFFGFDIYPYILFHFLKCFLLFLYYIHVALLLLVYVSLMKLHLLVFGYYHSCHQQASSSHLHALIYISTTLKLHIEMLLVLAAHSA